MYGKLKCFSISLELSYKFLRKKDLRFPLLFTDCPTWPTTSTKNDVARKCVGEITVKV